MLRALKERWQVVTIGLLSLALAGMIVVFGIFGRIADSPSTDGRARLLLTNAERDFVLKEMRHMLMAVQAVLVAVNEDDMAAVTSAAREAGMAEVRAIPAEIRLPLMTKLPIEFKQLGFGVHEGFDELALDAESLGDRQHTLRQLANLMDKCIACHAAYTVMPAGAIQ